MHRYPTNFLLMFSVAICSHGQNNNISENYVGVQERPVNAYYSSVDQKSNYQKHKIHNLKDELNNYSGRLHNLQKRFDEIFYGLSSKSKHSKPFGMNEPPGKPNQTRKYWYETNASNYVMPSGKRGGNSEQEELKAQNEETSNANVKGKDFTESSVVEPTRSKVFKPIDFRYRVGNYLIVSPGVAFPFKGHRSNDGGVDSYRKYVPGFTANIATGFERGPYRFGIGTMYRTNSHDGESFHGFDQLSEKSHSYAGYLDLGYKANLNYRLDAYFGIGLGYYQSSVNIPHKVKEQGFYGTGSLGLSWNLTELFAFRVGYRYAHDEEVPTHIGEVGLNFFF
mgnify:FL=1